MIGENVKAQYKHVIDLIETLSPIWQDRMGLNHYRIEHVFLESFDADTGDDDFKTTALTESRWQYLQAKIKWFLPSMVRQEDGHLELTLVHELVHVLLGAEQTLVFERGIDEGDGMFDTDADKLMTRYSEQLELTTEMTARAIYAGWMSSSQAK